MPKAFYCNLTYRRMSNNMIKISQIYWTTRKKLDKEIAAFDNYSARYSKTIGDYNFDYCKTCFGPTIGHKDIDCTDIDWTDKDINDIKDIIKDSEVFKKKFGLMKGNEDLVKTRKPIAQNNAGSCLNVPANETGLPAKTETMDYCANSNEQTSNLIDNDLTAKIEHEGQKRTELKFACNQGDNVFLETTDSKQHGDSMHNEKILFACEECDKWYRNSDDLKAHNQVTHKVFECDYCNDTMCH